MTPVSATGTQVPDSSLNPPLRPRWGREVETYGEWVRNAPSTQLTRDERARLKAEREWEAANPIMVRRLEETLGLVAVLRRDRYTLSHEAEGMAWKRQLPVYKAGLRVRVFARIGSYLLARTIDDVVLKLRLDWINVIIPTLDGSSDADELAAAMAEDATR